MFRFFGSIGLFFSLLSLAACNSPEKLICRTWKIEKADFDEAHSSLSADQRKSVSEQLTHSTLFTFKKDSAYVVLTKEGETAGKWKFTADKKGFHSETGAVKVDMAIIQLDKKKLVFEGVAVMADKVRFTCVPATNKK